MLLLLSGGLVPPAEVINTALDSVVERIGVQHHPMAGLAKIKATQSAPPL